MFGEFNTNCNDEATIKIVGKLCLEFPEIQEDLQKQIKIRNVLEEVLYNYTVATKETSLVASDIDDKLNIYFKSKEFEGASPETLRQYRYQLRIFASCLRKPLSAITTMDLKMFVAARCKDMTPGSKNGQISVLKSFFGWLAGEEYILKNPAARLNQTKEPKRVRQALSDEEIELLREACKTERQKALLEFLVSTGCRLSECFGADKKDINWHDRSLLVIGKGDKQREVCFSVKEKILLQKYLESRKDEDPALFVTERYPVHRLGKRSIQREIKKIAKGTNSKKSIYPHLMRHSFATHSLNAGMDITILQNLMGHSTPATTQIYAQLSQENIKHSYKKIY